MSRRNPLLLRNLIYSLVLFGKIKTTRSRAKEMIKVIDRLVNKIKKGNVSAKREVLKILPQKEIVEKLEKEIVAKLGGRTSGYTRIIKIGRRQGDAAAMVVVEWVGEEKEPKEIEEIKEKGETKKGKKVEENRRLSSKLNNDKTNKRK